MKVRICNSYSRPFRLRRGVPQGSVLGPVLFLYINDLPTFLPKSVKTSLYADDLAIWASSLSVECATSTVQASLNRLVEWSSKWRLLFNPLKCETSFFSLDPYQSRIQPFLYIFNTPLKSNPHPTFLGVTFDRTLSNTMSYSCGKSFTADSVLFALSPLPFGAHQNNVQSGPFQHQIPPVSHEELTLPRSARCALSRLHCNGHSTLLNTYLHRVGLLHAATVVLNHRTFDISC